MLLDGPLGWARNQGLFVYLDAHWDDNLPLAEELAIVFAVCRNAIVMVDDFQVPFDDGYGYDDYGTGKSLIADYIEPVVAAHSLGVFYPSTPSVPARSEAALSFVAVQRIGYFILCLCYGPLPSG
jgi:hypothetical protein